MPDPDLLLSRIEDVFEIVGRGCVIIPGVEPSLLGDRVVRRGADLDLRRPDGSMLSTHVHEIECLAGLNHRRCFPITLPPGVNKADVPTGTEVWLRASIDRHGV